MRMSIGARVVFAIGLLGVLVALPRAETRTSDAMNAKEKANLQHVRSWWLECLEGRNLDATAKYQADSYIQHNINFPTGRAGFMKVFGERFKAAGGPVTPPPTEFKSPPVVQFAKGDFVVLVWEREGKDPVDPSKTYKYNTYDMLRIENGKVAEHWDYALLAKGTPRGGAPDGIDYEKVKFDFSPQEKKNLEIATVEFKDIRSTATSSSPRRSWRRRTSSTTRPCPRGARRSSSTSAAGGSPNRFRPAGKTSRR